MGSVAIVFVVLLAASPGADARPRVGYERWGIGPVHLHDSIKSVRKKIGRPLRVGKLHCSERCKRRGCHGATWSAWYSGYRQITFSSVTCQLNRGRVKGIYTQNSLDRARAGIHVGSSASQVRRAYPKSSCHFYPKYGQGDCEVDRMYCKKNGPIPNADYELHIFFSRLHKNYVVDLIDILTWYYGGRGCSAEA